MISVGIDVSKGKSTVCVLKPGGEVLKPPFELRHTRGELSSLVSVIQSYPALKINKSFPFRKVRYNICRSDFSVMWSADFYTPSTRSDCRKPSLVIFGSAIISKAFSEICPFSS